MGINISVKKVINRTTEETWTGKIVPFYETEIQNWFDPIRYSGDREFVLENDFTYIDEDAEEDMELARPSDFDKTRKWINKNVYEGNQSRLLEALDKLEKDETLAFSWSW